MVKSNPAAFLNQAAGLLSFSPSAGPSCFPDKLRPANRAGNLDFPFSARDAQFIFTFGAFIIPVILIAPLRGLGSKKALEFVPESQKLLIFRPSL